MKVINSLTCQWKNNLPYPKQRTGYSGSTGKKARIILENPCIPKLPMVQKDMSSSSSVFITPSICSFLLCPPKPCFADTLKNLGVMNNDFGSNSHQIWGNPLSALPFPIFSISFS